MTIDRKICNENQCGPSGGRVVRVLSAEGTGSQIAFAQNFSKTFLTQQGECGEEEGWHSLSYTVSDTSYLSNSHFPHDRWVRARLYPSL